MTHDYRARPKRRLFIERLESRRVLAVTGLEVVELRLDVTRDDVSIVQPDRSFSVAKGDRFDVELQYSDLRPRFAALGVLVYNAELKVESSASFRPVVGERQIAELSGDLNQVTGGEIVLGAEGVALTETIPLQDFDEAALKQAVASILDIQLQDLQIIDVVTGNESRTLDIRFISDSVAFQDIPNLTIDTSGITGTTIDVQLSEIPAFVNNDPAQGINPQAFLTSIDLASPSLNGLEVYTPFSGTYVAGHETPFQRLGFFGPFVDLPTIAASNNATFDPEAFTVASIRLEAIEPVSGATFQITTDLESDGQFAIFTGDVAREIDNEEILVDVEDDPEVPGDDRAALAVANVTETQRPFHNAIEPLDVNNDGDIRPFDLVGVIAELTNRAFSNADGSLKQPIPDPVPAFYDVNGDNMITRRDTDALRLALGMTDFGDAPTAAQSGFASSYPTTLAEDGARHLIGSLVLGEGVQSESDGVPDADAASEEEDDGVLLGSSLPVTPGEESTATVQITASEAGIVDAWIDFNRDGDWNDAGERIFDGKAVDAGTAEHAFVIPGDAVEGTTFARFRINSERTPLPTGLALEGEVEDYAVVLEAIQNANPTIQLPTSGRIRAVDGEIIIDDGNEVLFARPINELESLTLMGSSQANQVTLDTSGGNFIPSQGLSIDGGAGDNSLLVTGELMIDAAAGSGLSLHRFSTLDLSDSVASVLRLDAAFVDRMVPGSGKLSYRGGDQDRLLFADADQWAMGEPIVSQTTFLQTAINQSAGMTIEADVASPYQNLIDPSDVSNQESITARDALLIILELGRRNLSTGDQGLIKDPLTIQPWPGIYPDQNGSNTITALDAIRVINELARRSLGSEQELTTPTFGPPASPIATDALLEATDEPTLRDIATEPTKIVSHADSRQTRPSIVDLPADIARHEVSKATEHSLVDSLLGDNSFLHSLSSK